MGLDIPDNIESVVGDKEVFDPLYLFLLYVRPNHWMIKQPEINAEDVGKLKGVNYE